MNESSINYFKKWRKHQFESKIEAVQQEITEKQAELSMS